MTPGVIKRISEKRFTDACASDQTHCYYHRLFDTSDVRQRGKAGSLAHMPKNPSDFVVTFCGKMFYAEIKGITGDRFPFSHLEPSQLAGMFQQIAAGGNYYLFINQISANEWFCMPAQEIMILRKMGKKSVSLLNIRKDYSCGTDPFARFRQV